MWRKVYSLFRIHCGHAMLSSLLTLCCSLSFCLIFKRLSVCFPRCLLYEEFTLFLAAWRSVLCSSSFTFVRSWIFFSLGPEKTRVSIVFLINATGTTSRKKYESDETMAVAAGTSYQTNEQAISTNWRNARMAGIAAAAVLFHSALPPSFPRRLSYAATWH